MDEAESWTSGGSQARLCSWWRTQKPAVRSGGDADGAQSCAESHGGLHSQVGHWLCASGGRGLGPAGPPAVSVAGWVGQEAALRRQQFGSLFWFLCPCGRRLAPRLGGGHKLGCLSGRGRRVWSAIWQGPVLGPASGCGCRLGSEAVGVTIQAPW